MIYHPVILALRSHLVANTQYGSYFAQFPPTGALVVLFTESARAYIQADAHVWQVATWNAQHCEIEGYLSMWAERSGHNRRIIEVDYSNPRAFDLIVEQLDILKGYDE